MITTDLTTSLQIYYFGHSAWVLESNRAYMTFDLQDSNVRTGGRLAEGVIDVSLLEDKPIYTSFPTTTTTITARSSTRRFQPTQRA